MTLTTIQLLIDEYTELMQEYAALQELSQHSQLATFQRCELQDAIDKKRAEIATMLIEFSKDTNRLNWIARQDLSELSMHLIVDAPGDGNTAVHGDEQYGEGRTLREAIDNAMQKPGACYLHSEFPCTV